MKKQIRENHIYLFTLVAVSLLSILSFSLFAEGNLRKEKTVAIGGSISEVIYALGHEKDLAAVDLSSVYPHSLAKLPKIGYWLRLTAEGILSLKPTTVIASEKAKPKQVLEDLKNFGVKVHLIDDKPTAQSVEAKILQIAKILNEESKGKTMVARIHRNVDLVRREVKSHNKKVLFIFYRSDSQIMASGKQTAAETLIQLSGGKNAVDFSGYKILSQEALVKLDPDVIIVGDLYENRFDANKITSKAILISNAAKRKQIYSIDMLLVSGFSSRFDTALMKFSCYVNEQKLSYCSKQ